MPIVRKIVVLFLLLLCLLTPVVFAQETEEASPAAEATETTEVNYDLPYPGILPDHPLYKLKVLRDKIVLFLIRDPLKKAAKHLQMADKEFLMALKLAEKDKVPLAQHTAFKAEHHVTLAVTEIKNAVYYANKEFPKNLADRVHKASLKHQELLEGIMARTNDDEKEPLKTIKEFSIRNDSELYRFEEELAEEILLLEGKIEQSEKEMEKEPE